MFDLSNKIALVTGGSSGLGLAIAQRFERAGATAVVCDLKPPDDSALGRHSHYVEADVSDADSLAQALSQANEHVGNFDVVVNNAGINGEDGVAIEDSSLELTRRLFEINTLGVYHGLKYAPRHMNDGGSIINTASLGATFVFPGSGPYSASKASVLSLTQMSALELAARKIRVNAVAPAFIRTPMAAQDLALFEQIGLHASAVGRIAEPEEIAAAYHFLAADDSSYVNGQVLTVDGGMSLGFTASQLDWLSSLIPPGDAAGVP